MTLTQPTAKAGPLPLVIIGASTGGTRVLPVLFARLPVLNACIVIVQHITVFMTPVFTKTLNDHSLMSVRVAAENDRLERGTVLVAPGQVHCLLVRNERIHLDDGEKVNFVRPSIDVTMLSLQPDGRQLYGVVLTGMGRDGAAGLRHLKQLGGTTIAQDKATCAVYGMPAEAVKTGCVDYVMPPEAIADLLAKELG